MIDIEQKLGEYEGMAVSVANTMHNDCLRAESSKEVINSFPNVRLASEKDKKRNVEGRGRKLLPSILLTAIVGTGCFGLGYNIRSVKENSQRMYTIDELITQDLSRNKEFTFTGDINFFTEMYSLRILNLRASDYVTNQVRQHFQKYIDPVKPNTINYAGDKK